MHIFRPQCYETPNEPKEKFGKVTNTWRLKNILLKNEWANQAVKEEINVSMWKSMKMITPQPKTPGAGAAKAVIRESIQQSRPS